MYNYFNIGGGILLYLIPYAIQTCIGWKKEKIVSEIVGWVFTIWIFGTMIYKANRAFQGGFWGILCTGMYFSIIM